MTRRQMEIRIKCQTELSDDGQIHIIYVPDQDQLLEAGKEYELIIEEGD
jgi:hypothetical protein